MKRLNYLIILLAVCSVARAQYVYKPFRVDVGSGYSVQIGNGCCDGFLLSAEPKYTFAEHFTVGVRWEWTTMSGDKETEIAGELTTRISTRESKQSTALLPTFDYHFTSGTFRPFAGAGIGAYFMYGDRKRIKQFILEDREQVYTSTFVSSDAVRPGFMLRAGFDVPHFRLAIAYNYAGRNRHDIRHDYLSLNCCGYIGGGKMRKIHSDRKRQ